MFLVGEIAILISLEAREEVGKASYSERSLDIFKASLVTASHSGIEGTCGVTYLGQGVVLGRTLDHEPVCPFPETAVKN